MQPFGAINDKTCHRNVQENLFQAPWYLFYNLLKTRQLSFSSECLVVSDFTGWFPTVILLLRNIRKVCCIFKHIFIILHILLCYESNVCSTLTGCAICTFLINCVKSIYRLKWLQMKMGHAMEKNTTNLLHYMYYFFFACFFFH